MKLSELIATHGFGGVNEKTTISIAILDKLVNENFEGLTRVKALGFVSILKREYGVELDDLESSIKSYFDENEEEDSEPILISVDRTENNSGFFKWFIIVALLGGLWYLYNSNKLDGNLSNVDSRENMLNDSEILKSSVSNQSAKESVIVKKDNNETKVEIQTVEIEDKIINESELNSSVEVESNSTVESSEAKVEENSSVKADSTEEIKEIESSEKVVKDSATETTSVDEAVEETSIESVEDIIDDTIIESSDDNTIADSTIVDGEEKAEIIYNVTVNPRINLWFGFINIDTKDKREFMTTDSKAIDVAGQRWLLVTGHGRVTVATDSKSIELNDRNKHYFYMDSQEIREINRAEFKKFNGGRSW